MIVECMMKILPACMRIMAVVSMLSLPVYALAQELSDKEKMLLPKVEDAPFEIGQYVRVGGVKLHYHDKGAGDPILFIHGNPTSSYLWRNITPYLEEQGRVIALDLVGMGRSDKPEIDYRYDEHYAYLDAFIRALELKNITLVVHDWGAALGFDYARRNPDSVKAIAFMEGVLPPIFPQESYEAMGDDMGGLFEAIRTKGRGEEMIVENHMFIEELLPQLILRTLGADAMEAYRLPYGEKDARTPLLTWPRQLPIAGWPQDTHRLMKGISNYMQTSQTPMLLLYAQPGLLISPELVKHYQAVIPHLETAYIGAGLHFIQEDQPDAIGRALSDWYRRVEKESAMYEQK